MPPSRTSAPVPAGTGPILFGDFELDVERYELRRGGEAVAIPPKAFDLLQYLVRHRDRMVTKDELLDALWPDERVTQSSLTSCMNALRHCLEDDGDAQRFVQTVRGRGYRFVAPLVLEGSAAAHAEPVPGPQARPVPAGVPRALRRSRLALIGRSDEVDRLSVLLREGLAGRGQIALIVGEAGIGKSRLAAEYVTRAEAAGYRCVRGVARDCGGTPAFGLWIEAARALIADADGPRLERLLGTHAADVATLLPEIATILPRLVAPRGLEGEQAQFRLLDSMTAFLQRAAHVRPTLVLLEDLHWADHASLRLLGFLGPAIESSPLVVVATYRDVEVEPEHPLFPIQAALRRQPHCERIELGGLSPEAVDLLARRYGGTPLPRPAVGAVARITEGNPLFVLEMLDHLRSEGLTPESEDALHALGLPEGVREVIGLRIARLSGPCLRMLSRAAVIGREFSLDVLEAIDPAEDETLLDLLDEAVGARVVSERRTAPGHYAFTHALIREVLNQRLNATRRTRLHERIGELLERRIADAPPRTAHGDRRRDSLLSEVAHHFVAARSPALAPKAVEYAARAGDHAAAMLAYDDAAALYTAALSVTEVHDDDGGAVRRCALLRALGEVRVRAGFTQSGHEAFLQCADLARRLHDVDAFAHAALESGRHLRRFGTADETPVRLLEEALELAGMDRPTLRARLLARLGVALRHAPGSLGRRIGLEEEAVALATRSGDGATLARVLDDTIWALWRPDNLAQRLVRIAQLVELAHELGSAELEVCAQGRRVVALMEAGEIAEVERALELHGRLAEGLRLPLYRWDGLNYRCALAMLRGRYAEAERHAEAAYAAKAYVHPDNADQIYGVQMGLIRFALGRAGEHVPVVTDLIDRHPTTWRCALAWLVAALGHLDRARALLDDLARNRFAALPFDSAWLASMTQLSMATRLVGHREHAAQLYELLAPYAGQFPVITEYGLACHGSMHHYLGLLTATMGRWDEAIAELERALATHRAMGCPPETATTLYEYGCVLLDRGRRGDVGRARSMLAEARAIADSLGMGRLRELASQRRQQRAVPR